jgi:hypothetical protein
MRIARVDARSRIARTEHTLNRIRIHPFRRWKIGRQHSIVAQRFTQNSGSAANASHYRSPDRADGNNKVCALPSMQAVLSTQQSRPAFPHCVVVATRSKPSCPQSILTRTPTITARRETSNSAPDRDGNGALRPVRATGTPADELGKNCGDASLLLHHTPPALQNQIALFNMADSLNTSPRPLPSAFFPMTIKLN